MRLFRRRRCLKPLEPESLQLIERLEDRRLLSAFVPDLGVYRASNLNVLYDWAPTGAAGGPVRDGVADAARPVGQAGDKIVAGDFNGDTLTDTAIFRQGTWFVDY